MVDEQNTNKKMLSMLLFSGPYGSLDAEYMCRIGERALDMGYGVHIFLYGEGVHAQLTNQAPKVFFNIGEALERLVSKGAVIKSCVRCSQARGYLDRYSKFDESSDRYPSSKSIDAVKIYSLYGFIDMIKTGNKLITFGSS